MSRHVLHEHYDRCMYCACKESIFNHIDCADEPRKRSAYLDEAWKEHGSKTEEQRVQEFIAFLETTK